MSSHRIHVPAPAEIDYHSDHEAERRRRALAMIAPEDLLAAVMGALAERPLHAHPLGPMVLWMLDKAMTPGHGGELFDGLKQAVMAQVERLLAERLADPHVWEN